MQGEDEIKGVEIRDDPHPPQWTKSVFVDGFQLRRQVCEDPSVHDGYLSVRVLAHGVGTPEEQQELLNTPYQVKPYTTEFDENISKGRMITTLYLKYP